MGKSDGFRDAGFSLVEMAVVLVILGLVISSLLLPISTQREVQKINATRTNMSLIAEALYGFVILNGRLPCPSTEADPSNVNYGREDASCSSSYVSDGFLPWKTLGVPETDEWGARRTDAASPWHGYWRYRIDRNFTTSVSFNNNILSISPAYGDSLSVIDADGNALTTVTERPLAIVYSTGANLVENGENADFEAMSGTYQSGSISTTFDDMLFWITRPILVNRMVMAGKLP